MQFFLESHLGENAINPLFHVWWALFAAHVKSADEQRGQGDAT